MGIALVLGALFLAASGVLFTLDALGVFDTHVYSTPETGTAFNVSSILHDGTPLSVPVATPVDSAPVARLLIPRIKVDAPVVTKGVGADGVMQVPDNAVDVAWYDFAARPGSGGNVVFSGHVDFHGVGPAVFWNLGKLEQGDEIDVALTDGKTYKYRVTGKGVFDANSAPVDEIVGPTSAESVTLITCTGVFNPSTHQYNKRLVVRAERVDMTS
jgi:LPXTG-site transpeptidase (sortase) family protein